MAIAELSLPLQYEEHLKKEPQKFMTNFEEGLFSALELLPHQLKEQNITFKEKITSVFNPQDFLLEDDYTSPHYLATRITNNWTTNHAAIADAFRLKHPSESYKSLFLQINPMLKNTYPEIEEELPGRISYALIQGFIHTEIKLREQYNLTAQENIFSLPLNARNTMFFSLSDALTQQENENLGVQDMQEGIEIRLI